MNAQHINKVIKNDLLQLTLQESCLNTAMYIATKEKQIAR